MNTLTELIASSGSVLFILDASNAKETELLTEWAVRQIDDPTATNVLDLVSLSISRFQENIRTGSLVEQLDAAPPDTLVIPARVAWTTSIVTKGDMPRLRDLILGNSHRPGAWRARIVHRKNPGHAQCIAAEPATIREILQRYQNHTGTEPDARRLSEYIAGQAGLALDVAERRLKGSRYKVPSRVSQHLLASSQLGEAIARISKASGAPVAQLRRDAQRIVNELLARPRIFWVDLLAAFNRFAIGLGYDPSIVVDTKKLERVRQLTRDYPSAILFTHKTHVDGMALSSLMYQHDFPVPHLLGGINMAFAGMGFIGRRSGCVFIRRSFADEPLYKSILQQYIGYLLEKRFPLTWSFEGTRSRTGKLLPPRYGLIKYVMDSASAMDACNLHLIPVAINYDLIGEVSDYSVEESGVEKRPESLKWFIGYLRRLRQPKGRIYVDFGQPVVVNDMPSDDDRHRLQKVAFQIGVEVNKVTPITLPSLVTLVLFDAIPHALTQDELARKVWSLVAWASSRNIAITSDFAPGNNRKLAKLAEIMVSSGLITRYDGGPETVYAIAPTQTVEASYYRNTTIHHFVNKAIVELALIHCREQNIGDVGEFWNEAERLRNLFKFEFFYAPIDEFRAQLRHEMDRCCPDWEKDWASDPGYAGQLRERLSPTVARGTLLTISEGYLVAADVLAGTPAHQALEEGDCIAKSLSFGQQALLQRRVSSEASIGKHLFQNAYKLMSHLELTEAGGEESRKKRLQHSNQMRELADRIDMTRSPLRRV